MLERRTPAELRVAGTRNPDIELLRGMAISAVVAIHTTWHYGWRIGFETPPGRFLGLLMLASGFGVPLFYAISALLLTLDFSRATSARQYAARLARRATRLLPAYVAWSLISLLLLAPQSLSSAREIARTLLLGTADTQFYYIPLLFQLYVAWPLMQPLARWSARSRAAAGAVAAAGAAVSLGWWAASARGWIPALAPNLFVFFFVYAALGIAAAHHVTGLKRLAARKAIRVTLAIAAAAALLVYYASFLTAIRGYRNVGAVLLAAMLFQPRALAYVCLCIAALASLAFASRSQHAAGVLTWLAANSYGIFLVHFLALRAISHAPSPVALTSGDGAAVMVAKTLAAWLASLLASALFVELMSRWKPARTFVSNRF